MSNRNGWTTHGHPIPGQLQSNPRPKHIARCGGVKLCTTCQEEAKTPTQPTELIQATALVICARSPLDLPAALIAARALADAQLLVARPAPFKFTDAEWRKYQRLPDQGFSHRRWLEAVVNSRTPARTVPTREQIEIAVGGVLFNASNHPDPVAILGKSIAPLRDKITDAILALLADQPTVAEVEANALEREAKLLAQVEHAANSTFGSEHLNHRAQQIRDGNQ